MKNGTELLSAVESFTDRFVMTATRSVRMKRKSRKDSVSVNKLSETKSLVLLHLGNCCRHFKLNNSKLLIFAPHRQQRSTDASLGKPYGIQLGALSVNSDYFDDDIRGKQAFDTLLVAHGVGFFKRAVNWTQRDIDEIIISGSELYKETKNVSISKLSQLTKGFTFKKHFIQVTVSEPVVVGKVMTVSERSMNLLMGLEKFFSQHKHGILQTPELDLYISYCKAFVVFDPRGRSLNGRRCRSGEAASMVLGRLTNVYHLIVNLSKIDVNSPFKISTIAITQTMKSKYSPEKFSAVSGNPMQICRTDDYVILDEHAAYLKGSIHLSSRVFQEFSPKQHLTTAIMAMAYAKIDPPNSWSSSILDRVLHFGAKLYSDVLQREPIRNIALPDIPSKFYVGDLYRVGIMIVPFFKRTSLQRTRSICDNSITKALHEIFESSFHCFLLQIGNSTYAMWQMLSSEVFYFFDGEQKDSEGNLDRYEGSSSLFMVGSIDKLCHLVVTRLMMQSYPQNATLDIHGLKIVEVTKLSSQQQKLKPNFKTVKKSCIKPLTAEAANKFEDSPSVVDSVAPLLTADKILKLREKLPEKPLFRQVSDLNSSSLVCCKTLTYEDIVNSVEKTSLIIPSGFAPETVEIILRVNSEILHKATEDEGKI